MYTQIHLIKINFIFLVLDHYSSLIKFIFHLNFTIFLVVLVSLRYNWHTTLYKFNDRIMAYVYYEFIITISLVNIHNLL